MDGGVFRSIGYFSEVGFPIFSLPGFLDFWIFDFRFGFLVKNCIFYQLERSAGIPNFGPVMTISNFKYVFFQSPFMGLILYAQIEITVNLFPRLEHVEVIFFRSTPRN